MTPAGPDDAGDILGHRTDDVRGINASLDLITRTRGGPWPSGPVTEDLLAHDVDVSWWVTPAADERGFYTGAHRALRHRLDDDFPFTAPFWSDVEIPEDEG